MFTRYWRARRAEAQRRAALDRRIRLLEQAYDAALIRHAAASLNHADALLKEK